MSLTIVASFTQTNGDLPATGLTLADIALYLYAINKSTGVATEVWDGTQNPTAEISNIGTYLRVYADADVDTYDYMAAALYSGAVSLDANWVVGGAGEDHAGTWAYVSRTLTQTAAEIASAIDGDEITIHRGDSLSISITGLGDISSRTKLWFTVKYKQADADTAAWIQIEETAGLVYLNGADASARAANGTITVDDEVTGAITITLDEVETDDLEPRTGLYYDVQMKTATDVATLSDGEATVTADITRVVA